MKAGGDIKREWPYLALFVSLYELVLLCPKGQDMLGQDKAFTFTFTFSSTTRHALLALSWID